MVVPAPSFHELSFAYEVHADMCRHIGAKITSQPSSRSSRPVFLSKRNLNSGVWRFINESDLASELERRGVEIVDPERLSFSQQIELFNSHKFVHGIAGSGVHTTMLSRYSNHGVGFYDESN